MTTIIPCKLTRPDLTTHAGYQWTVGEWREAPGKGRLCTDGWFHAYDHPYLAVLHSPAHGIERYTRLWLIETGGDTLAEGQVKRGWQRLRLVREIPLPAITTEQRVEYAIRVSLLVCDDPGHVRWANRWLDGTDRSEEAAARAADESEEAAARAADESEEEWAAVWAARAADAANAADAEWATAWTANASQARPDIDLIAAAEQVLGEWKEPDDE